ncbi:hypothetical protein EJB05_42321, partial [Eragrostis curvula]
MGRDVTVVMLIRIRFAHTLHLPRHPRRASKLDEPAKISALLPKKSAPVVGTCRAIMVKMEAMKRKLREGYQEAADVQRQRKIIVIEVPKVVEQKQLKMHPVSQAKRETSTVGKRQRKEPGSPDRWARPHTSVATARCARKGHLIIRERSQARYAASTVVKRSLMPSFCSV